MIKILFKRISEGAKAPERKHEGDAGWDLVAVGRKISGNIVHYSTGLAFAIPKGYWLMVAARSSIRTMGMWLANGVGLIDSGYRGEIQADFYRFGPLNIPYETYERILQIVPMPCRTDEVEFIEVDELPESWDGRNDGGFGSTGK